MEVEVLTQRRGFRAVHAKIMKPKSGSPEALFLRLYREGYTDSLF